MKTILVTGGAGYIGSHTCRLISSKEYRIIVLDNLEYGHLDALSLDEGCIFINGDIGDKLLLVELFEEYDFEAVVHFAAYTYVGESVNNPEKYYRNNFTSGLILLDIMMKYGCRKLVFSSTCATYGNPQYIPMDEAHPQQPLNAYGRSKYFFEQAVNDFHKAYGLEFVFLRYFNASGAARDGDIGEDHNPETHLIPLVLQQAKGERQAIKVFGSDYPTLDGTCIRDYIHVEDLATAHLKALQYLDNGYESTAFNLGTGQGYSVLQVINTVEKITGLKVEFSFAPKREGDAESLVANVEKAAEKLGWRAEIKKLEEIIESAWNWENGPNKGKYKK
ncbi:MAG: UDP-glucose 4-epimerase GalE [Mongoliibacter sp.]|uniref:UDP-glucose 4-epimerase GalE n=1 Tax=Mongoliibacter sp. TaxID=2022438 RepID=UPI0012F0C258|nr:UDP-glucose 4-epimerase GalE [Mongoliibacter sp.]TVP46694.1 MAG: UDP-glucose 4-epimerase GalE [Mongoliibacter sp.]